MKNKIFIPQHPANAQPLLLDKEIKEIRALLDRIEKEVSGKPINEVCRKLIKESFRKSSGFLESTLNYKKFSDQDKRR
jgi:hypothetical protein